MIAFKKIWDDVCSVISNGEIKDIDIVENFKNGFVVKEGSDTHFLTKQDFVDFWCSLVCLNKIDEEEILKEEGSGKKLVYDILKRLPYINENEGSLKISEKCC
ncbi:MAG: hypothetical protein LKE46_06545 [Clostridium sp.]|uniref:hypothetical protein n=1 Tax=Clostridium sp. TaxID=1506 RepID=UPI0025C49F88|nr:hypothetical protein [Clostridium sp.]MCH3963917.1 hypothetical protein [Clostridium sp.]MCI1716118.1 hypothetical protein [Clostridium sp.]MCI1800642.1 hypothetical protein [Clostridium sp.]MCI1814295.1 hypothetical protein [Clostridium sp.]MCI1871194.1 hypothetical protein [Clostridium sp.]